MFRRTNPALRIIPLFIILIVGCVLISCSKRTIDDNIDETIVEKKITIKK